VSTLEESDLTEDLGTQVSDSPTDSESTGGTVTTAELRIQHRLRLFAWLGVVTLFTPVFLIVDTTSSIEVPSNQVVAIWTFAIYERFPVFGPQWRFTPLAFYSNSPLTNIGIVFLAEFLLLVVGCFLLLRGRGGSVSFIAAAVLETAVVLYVIVADLTSGQLFPMTTYIIPLGPVLAWVVGVGSLVLMSQQNRAEREDETHDAPERSS
jgi:hypothetical protein